MLDTHVHADHLSRSRRLAELAGAKLWLPEQRRVHFAFGALREGDALEVGDMRLRALHTPGHTLESTTYRVGDRWLLTGDTLFLAAVGRPDLEASTEGARPRAELLYASLRRLLALEDDLLVLPAHTDGPVAFDRRVVGAPLEQVRGAIRLPDDREAFIEHLLGRIPATPPNHHTIVTFNEAGELPPGDPTDLEAGANRCAVS